MAEKVIKKGNVPLYTYVKKTQKKEFEQIADDKGTTASALMRDVLEKYIEKNKKKKAA